jgi:isoquinoline 1-oxidoreductase beta subunit
MEAPAEDGYANYALGKGFVLGETKMPKVLVGTVDGVFLQVSKAMHLQITGGSLSVRTTGVYGMRVAGAAARQLLLEAAAETWDVEQATLTTSKGMISHAASGRQAPYATFAGLAGSKTPSATPTLKTPDQFTIMGQDKPRLDIPAKVDGSAMFGIDVTVAGMKYAAIKAAPVFGASLASADTSRARAMPGVVDIIELSDAIAVVADGYWQASQALATISPQWTSTAADTVNSESIINQFKTDIQTARDTGKLKSDTAKGDTNQAFAQASRVVERDYQVPYLAHACMEPMNAVARFENGRCDIWTGTQNPLGFKYNVAEALEMDAAQVTVTNYFMGGGFGRRSNADAAIQAARIAKAAGVPVKLIWSREEDMQHDHYRPAVVSRFRAALDADGLPLAWENQYVDKHEPVEAPLIPYAIANQAIGYLDSPTHVPFGPWRSVDHSQHGFFTESFIDELAVEAGKDPFQFRYDLLAGQPRHQKVLQLAADKANWQQPLGKNQGRGISMQNSFGTLVAEVVEVTVTNNDVRVDRVVVAVDPGFAVSPNGLAAQMESGVIYGLTAALYGEIDIDQGQVVQSNFHNYKMVRMDNAPRIETHIINSMESWGGAGEPGTPGTAPALANAIYAATGTRVRNLPVSNYEFNVQFVEQENVTG